MFVYFIPSPNFPYIRDKSLLSKEGFREVVDLSRPPLTQGRSNTPPAKG